MEKYFFEIPVYRCSPQKFERETATLILNTRLKFKTHKGIFTNEEIELKIAQSIERQYYCYEFNEVIGWIRLYVLGSQLRGRYYYESSPSNPVEHKKKITRGIRKKRFTCSEGDILQLSIFKDSPSKDIFLALIDELGRLNDRDPDFKSRYIDLTQLRNVGTLIDWSGVMKQLNVFK